MGYPKSHRLLLGGAVLLSTMICAHDSYAAPRTCSELFGNKSTLEGDRSSTASRSNEKLSNRLTEGMIIEMGSFLAKHPAFGADRQVSAGQFRVERVYPDGSVEVSRWEVSHVRYEASGFRGQYHLDKDIKTKVAMVVVYNPPKLKAGMVIRIGPFISLNLLTGPSTMAAAGTYRVETVFGDGSLALSRWEIARVRYERPGFKGSYYTKPNLQFEQVVEVVSE